MYRILIILFLGIYTAHAQNILSKNQYSVESALFLSSNKFNPFFFSTNTYGEVPFNSNFGGIRLEAKHEYDSTYTVNRKLEKFSYGYGLRTAVNMGKTSNAVLTEAYAKVRYGVFEMYAGRRREIVGLVDSSLSSGSYIWSGNALPIPKVQISIPNYTSILKNGLISIKGSYAHGWMGDGEFVKKVWLHQKTFYARIGNPYWRFKFYGGFNHQVQWGGSPAKPYYDNVTQQTISKYNTDFDTYLKVVSGVSLNKNSNGLTSGSPVNEALNRAGNHLGSIDIAFEYSTKFNSILIYRQSIYEDGSLFYLNNVSDGLLGISLVSNFRKIKKYLFEYLNTTNQGGKNYEDLPQLRGMDNYFNNGIYQDGWTYKNYIIGTPLIFSNSRNIIENLNDINYVFNNRVSAFIFGIKYDYLSFQNTTKILKSYNYGNYSYPLKFSNISIFQQISKTVDSNIISCKIALDISSYWKNRTGVHLTYIRQLN